MRRITLHNHPGGVYLTLVNKWVHFLNKFLAWLSGLSTSQKMEQKFASQCNFFQMASFSWLSKNHYERVCHLKSWPELTKFCSIFLVKTNLTNPFFFIFFNHGHWITQALHRDYLYSTTLHNTYRKRENFVWKVCLIRIWTCSSRIGHIMNMQIVVR